MFYYDTSERDRQKERLCFFSAWFSVVFVVFFQRLMFSCDYNVVNAAAMVLMFGVFTYA